jgi:hypothetical protein
MLKIGLEIKPSMASTLDRARNKTVERIMDELLPLLTKFTPKRSGAAARAWQKNGSGERTNIINNKAYIERLNEGYSQQSPRGIVEPALQELRSSKKRRT